MKVGIDGRALQFRSWGGVRYYTLGLLQALFSLDHENEYHVFYNAWKKIAVPEFSEFPKVTAHYSRWPNKFFNLSIKLFSQPTFHIASGALDILLVPNLNFVACSPEVKLIAVAHDLSFEHFPEHFPWRFRIWHQALNPRLLFHRADYTIALSEHTKADLIETYGIQPEKITVVYPGVMPRGPSSGRPEDGPPYILYFGALEPRKNIEGIIKAYEALRPREQLVIAGLSTTYVGRLKKRIAQSKSREHIRLIENPVEEEKAKLYAAAQLFVYPSFYEGFGFPPLEAMAAGVPVVASSAASVPEVCGDAALLVDPWNVNEIKEGMKILLEDPELRETYRAKGFRKVQEYSWEKCARELLEIFRTV